MVILKSQVVDKSAVSVTVQTTLVVPYGNEEPEGGSHTTEATATLSFVVTAHDSVLVERSVDSDDW